MTHDELVRSVMYMLAIDGVVDQLEIQFLKKLCMRLEVAKKVIDEAFNQIKQGKGSVHLPEGIAEKKRLFLLLIQAAAANQQIVPQERKLLDVVATKMGIPKAEVEKAVAMVTKNLQTSQPPPSQPLPSTPESVKKPAPAEQSVKKDKKMSKKTAVPSDHAQTMTCPKCGFQQKKSQRCQQCGVFIKRHLKSQQRKAERQGTNQSVQQQGKRRKKIPEPVDTEREELIGMMNRLGMMLFFVAGFSALSILWAGWTGLIQAVIMALLGVALKQFQSRSAAILLCVLAVGSLWAAREYYPPLDFIFALVLILSILPSLIMGYVGFFAVKATFKLHGELADPQEKPAIVGYVLSTILIVLLVFFMASLGRDIKETVTPTIKSDPATEKRILVYEQLLENAPTSDRKLDYARKLYRVYKSTLKDNAKAEEYEQLEQEYESHEESFEQQKQGYIESYYTSVIRVCNDIIASDPESLYAYVEKANAYQGLKNKKQAIEVITQAIDLAPNNADLYWERMGIYTIFGERAKAKQDEAKAMELEVKIE